MAENRWAEIWSGKPVIGKNEDGINEFNEFVRLKKANGFDVAVGNEKKYFEAFYNEWLNFFNTILDLSNGRIENVYEIGCGSGVNLYMFRNRNIKGGGCDYSQSMIETARENVPDFDFVCCEATAADTFPKYDVVMSESVFQYFDSLDYAEKVLRKMIEKSKKLVYVGEVHDKIYEEQLMEHRRKTIDDYDIRYKGLSKLFFEKSWFEAIAGEYGRSIHFEEVNNPEYINGKYLFNCYIYE